MGEARRSAKQGPRLRGCDRGDAFGDRIDTAGIFGQLSEEARRQFQQARHGIVRAWLVDGIAGFDDLIAFFKRLPNPDKQFAVMAGISHASFQQINYLTVYHILQAFFSQPEAVYRG